MFIFSFSFMMTLLKVRLFRAMSIPLRSLAFAFKLGQCISEACLKDNYYKTFLTVQIWGVDYTK